MIIKNFLNRKRDKSEEVTNFETNEDNSSYNHKSYIDEELLSDILSNYCLLRNT